jgi:hypothetical protein
VTIHSADSATLAVDGPLVDITLWLVASARQALTTQGNSVPTAVPGTAMIDTGASMTVVQQGLLGPLGLHPVSSAAVNTPTSQGVACPLYAVQLALPNGFIEVNVLEAPLQGQNIQALIGRDVLRHGVLIYEGHSGHFTLAF